MFNYIATTYFTFRTRSSVRRGFGFAASHLVNYLLQTGLLLVFVNVLGMTSQWALLPVMCICVPVNFMLVRFVFTHKGGSTK